MQHSIASVASQVCILGKPESHDAGGLLFYCTPFGKTWCKESDDFTFLAMR
jgi:hypothetical protein